MNPDDLIDLERLLPAAVAVAFHARNFDALQSWACAECSAFLSAASPLQDDPQFARAFALAFSRAVWNAMPLSASGRPPVAVAEPGRNEPCPCGSGRKYKQCCHGGSSLSSAVHATTLWPYVLEQLPRAERIALAQGARVPVRAIGAFAERALESGQARDAVDVLEPRLGSPERHHDELVAGLVDLLCDAYDQVHRTPRRKIAFLESLTERAPRSPLRSEAWQRLATIRMDARQNDAAWHAVREAQRDEPDSPALPLLEVQLLIFEGRSDEARQRADFWIRTLERAGAGRDPDDRRLEFLRAVREDPQQAMGSVAVDASGGAARPLAQWIEACRNRQVPTYALAQVELDDAGGYGRAVANAWKLKPPVTLQDVEQKWHAAFPLDKPFSIQDQPFEAGDVWEPATIAQWMAALEAHPEAFDSLDVLDDLVTALGEHPSAGAPGFNDALCAPLLARSDAILSHALLQQPTTVLPWRVPENRPALRALMRQFMLCEARHDQASAFAVAERMVRVNPDDNHGMRWLLVNDYLQRGDDAAALALAEEYPQDMAPETRFGRVLALFRLKRFAEAEAALRDARRALPKIIAWLLPGRIKRPEFDAMGVSIGGDDQAWLYRDMMRRVWMASPGAKEWLEKMSKLK